MRALFKRWPPQAGAQTCPNPDQRLASDARYFDTKHDSCQSEMSEIGCRAWTAPCPGPRPGPPRFSGGLLLIPRPHPLEPVHPGQNHHHRREELGRDFLVHVHPAEQVHQLRVFGDVDALAAGFLDEALGQLG